MAKPTSIPLAYPSVSGWARQFNDTVTHRFLDDKDGVGRLAGSTIGAEEEHAT